MAGRITAGRLAHCLPTRPHQRPRGIDAELLRDSITLR